MMASIEETGSAPDRLPLRTGNRSQKLTAHQELSVHRKPGCGGNTKPSKRNIEASLVTQQELRADIDAVSQTNVDLRAELSRLKAGTEQAA
ncbi:hypothetical protein WJX73_006979 [Symbiochloris irregularis]|uniref:Uncharacterized protein n=1 Tax=Symbiochloris irregularis TaxID=706552 RepID=A0AAW1PCA1_9CHLO